MNALGMAISNRKPKDGSVVHSDHGSQFTSWAFSKRVKGAGLALSMGRVGDAYDCDDGGVLGTHADRAAEPQPLAHASSLPTRSLST